MSFGDMFEKFLELLGIVFKFIFGVIGWFFDILIDVSKWVGQYYQEVGIGIGVLIVLSMIRSYFEKRRKKEKEAMRFEREMKRRETCPNCHERQGFYDSTDIVNQYETTKKVEEKTASGNYKTRYVKCTKVVEKEFYKCDNCGHRYEVDEDTRELD